MRKAVFFKLKPGTAQEYKKRHDELPDAMRKVLDEAGFRNYSIWRIDDFLFAYWELDDEERAERVLGSSAVFRRWRDWMEDVVAVDAEGKKEWPMELMFFHEGGA